MSFFVSVLPGKACNWTSQVCLSESVGVSSTHGRGRKELRTTWPTWTCRSPWGLMECTGIGKELCKASQSSLPGHGNQGRFLLTGKKKGQTSRSSTRRRRRIQVITASQLSSQEGYGATPPGRYFEVHKGQEGDWEQPRVNCAWLTSLLSMMKFIEPCKGRTANVVHFKFIKAFTLESFHFSRFKLSDWWDRLWITGW